MAPFTLTVVLTALTLAAIHHHRTITTLRRDITATRQELAAHKYLHKP
ncbi:hypothetical protein FOE67_24335, partial [Streptomyces calidiresistens]|nr:hypothetical protein [Streptomyces calidiresistens]